MFGASLSGIQIKALLHQGTSSYHEEEHEEGYLCVYVSVCVGVGGDGTGMGSK